MDEVVVEGVDLAAVVIVSGIELFVDGLFGLFIDFRQHDLAGDTFDNGYIDPTILHIQLVHENIRRENPELGLFFLLYLILNQSISHDGYLHILGRYDDRGFGVLGGRDRDQVSTVGTKVLGFLVVDFEEIDVGLLVREGGGEGL